MMSRFIISITLIVSTSIYWFIGISPASAQDIPLGAWRLHVSYNSITHIAFGNQTIYGAAGNGIMVVDLADKSVSGYNKLTGLSGADISSINYDNTTNQLLISYSDGNLDIIKNNAVINYNSLKNSTAVPGSKRINHINIRDGLAYLAADYGMVVFDLQRQEVKETWRDLGTSGTTLKIMQSAFKGDSIFLATEKGVLAGSLSNNLLDFNNWKRFQQGNFNAPFQSIAFFNNKIYASQSGSGLYRHENSWIKEPFLQNVPIQGISASASGLLIAQDTRLWKLETSNTLTEIISTLLTRPQNAKQDSHGKIWIGDARNGLISDVDGSFMSYILNGPSSTKAFRLKAGNNAIIALSGGYSNNFQALGNTGDVNLFTGTWSTEVSPLKDITDVDFRGEIPIASSFGYGVQTGSLAAPDVIYNKDNSPLLPSSGNAVTITAVKNSGEGTWIANYGVDPPLNLLDNNNAWQSFSFTNPVAKYPVNLTIDFYRNVWMQLDPARGGGVQIFNMENNRKAYLTEVVGSGGLPDRSVNAIAVDRDGFVWVGTNQGISYFPDPLGVFSSNVNAIKPIFENQYLLSDQRITAIAIDGGNRKWIGTERGVWLFNPTTEEVIYNFTQENSPLLSNVVSDIAINGQTGEVFFATDKGIVSFRSDATESELSFNKVRIFPNPVTAEYQGTIGITGLATDAVVKITDIRGKLVWQTQANGGTATWNRNDYNGRKASTGVYLIFSATQDGVESLVGKVVVVK